MNKNLFLLRCKQQTWPRSAVWMADHLQAWHQNVLIFLDDPCEISFVRKAEALLLLAKMVNRPCFHYARGLAPAGHLGFSKAISEVDTLMRKVALWYERWAP